MDAEEKEGPTRRANGSRPLPSCRYPDAVVEGFHDEVLGRLDALAFILALLTLAVCLSVLGRRGA